MTLPKVSSGARPHRITLQNPGTPAPDGDGGFTQTWADLSPATVYAAILPATARDLERLAAGTVIATGMRVLTFPFHAGVTTKTQVSWTDPAGRAHVASVTGVDNPEERCLETVCLCVEVVP